MTRKRAAQTQHISGAARTDKTEEQTGRKARPVQQAQHDTGEIAAAEIASVAADALPPPHPALVEMVRLLARADARRARTEEQETRK
jgi:hypothetical protein